MMTLLVSGRKAFPTQILAILAVASLGSCRPRTEPSFGLKTLEPASGPGPMIKLNLPGDPRGSVAETIYENCLVCHNRTSYQHGSLSFHQFNSEKGFPWRKDNDNNGKRPRDRQATPDYYGDILSQLENGMPLSFNSSFVGGAAAKQELVTWLAGRADGSAASSTSPRQANTDDLPCVAPPDPKEALQVAAQHAEQQKSAAAMLYLDFSGSRKPLTGAKTWGSKHICKIQACQAAAALALNSLSWQSTVQLPSLADKTGFQLAIDMRQLGWGEAQKSVVRSLGARSLGDKHLVIDGITFLQRALLSGTYNLLLNLPDPDSDQPGDHASFDQFLGVSSAEAFRSGQVKRVVVRASRVGENVRLMERMPIVRGEKRANAFAGQSVTYPADGYYWITYDSDPSNVPVDVLSAGVANHLPAQALSPAWSLYDRRGRSLMHNAEEIIFSLPNGLQGYLLSLVDAAPGGEIRLPKTFAPPEAAQDGLAQGHLFLKDQDSTIYSAISCMGCHRHGTVHAANNDVTDVLLAKAVNADEKAAILRHFPDQDALEKTLEMDDLAFLEALSKATSPFWQPGGKLLTPSAVAEFPEPLRACLKLVRE